MEQATYIHGMHASEQERLAGLNRLTNAPFLRYLAIRETDTVLEAGSGLGLLAAEAAQQLPRGAMVGIEYAPEQLARILVHPPNLRFLRGDAHHLPFPENRFDVVYCRYVLEHVRDPLRVLQEMRRVLKPGGRALAQENDILMVACDPDCPAFEVVWKQFAVLQARLGGDARIGKRLFGLFHQAGFREIELSFQPEIHPADKPTFRPWVQNLIDLLPGAADALQAQQLATQAEIEQAIQELQNLLERDDATALFHWNRACGIK